MTTVTDQDLYYFIYAVKNISEFDFSEYSDKSFKRRLQKVLVDYKTDIPSIVKKFKEDRKFLEKIVNEITVNTTELFRDPQIWHILRYKILPELKHKNHINIWHAGCSTGQEVYSMLIILNELGMFDKAKLLATDINSEVLDISKKGEYKYRFNIGYLDNFDKVVKENPFNYEEFNDVPYSKYFEIDKYKDLIKMNQFLVDKPFFRKHDLTKDDVIPFTKFDLIFCRNVIIYFNYNLQNRIFDVFQRSLFQGGYLFLGMHETILGPYASKFEKRKFHYVLKE